MLLSCPHSIRVAFCIPWPDVLGGPLLTISWYAIITVVCAAIGIGVAMRHIQREGEDAAAVLDCARYFLPAGLLGARLFFVILDLLGGHSAAYQANPLKILDIRGGGLNFFGLLLCGGLVVLYYARRIDFDVWLGCDAGALGLWIGQGLGRFNNLVNRELCGPPTGSSWFGILIPPQYRIPQYANLALYPPETRFHPTMIYESSWLLVTFVLVFVWYWHHRDHFKPGSLLISYLILAGLGRFLVETWRPDQSLIPGSAISYSRVLAAAECLLGIALYLYRKLEMRNHATSQTSSLELAADLVQHRAGGAGVAARRQ